MVLLLAGCAGPLTLVRKGNFEKALKITNKRLEKGNIRVKNINAFIYSFNGLHERDSIRAHTSFEQRSWMAAHHYFKKIIDRHSDCTEAITHIAQYDRSAELHLIDVDSLLLEAGRQSAIFYYEKASPHIAAAADGEISAARRAYELMDTVLYYHPDFPGGQMLSSRLFDQAATGILIKSYSVGLDIAEQQELLSELLAPKSYPQQLDWTIYFLEDSIPTDIDAILEIELQDLDAGRNSESTSTCSRSETICLGTVTKKVWSKKDSAYIQVEEPVYEDVSVQVTTYERSKRGSFSVHCTLLDSTAQKSLLDFKLTASASWSNTFSKYTGDRRAIGGFCCPAIGSNSSFPSDLSMLKRAARQMGRGLPGEIDTRIAEVR